MNFVLPAPQMQRSHGVAAISLGLHKGRARLLDLAQSGSAKVILPHQGAGMGAVPELVFLNTSGGLTGGDTLRYQITLGEGAQATATRRRQNAPIAQPPVWRGLSSRPGWGHPVGWIGYPRKRSCFSPVPCTAAPGLIWGRMRAV